MSDLVSVVIPCYNAEDTVRSAVESALRQSHRAVEVIVVDDGSKDASVTVLKEFGDSITLLEGPNRGGNAARNRGIRTAKGEWLQMLDADDTLDPLTIEAKLSKALRPSEVPCSGVKVLENDRDEVGPYFWQFKSFDLETIIAHGAPQTAAPLHRRSHLESVGLFDESLKCAQEFDLHLRLAHRLGLTFVSNQLPHVRMTARANSVSRQAGTRMLRTVADCILRTVVSADEVASPLPPKIRCAAGCRLGRLSARLARLGDYENAKAIEAEARTLTSQYLKTEYKGAVTQSLVRLLGIVTYERIKQRMKPAV